MRPAPNPAFAIPTMRRFITSVPALLVLLATCVTLLAGPRLLESLHLSRLAATVAVAHERLAAGTPIDSLETASRAVGEAVLPGVVHIDVEVRPSAEQRETMEGLRKRFGGRQRSPEIPPGHPGIPSTGSGWMYDNAGHIITNAHVVRDAETIKVELFDGRVFNADVVGRDDATDIAVISIDAGSENGGGRLFPLRRATGDPVYVGDRVFVFGSPFGFKFSMSQGIVSALGRSEAAGWVGMLGGYTNYIQTDAAMNPGNSGGPMVNARGAVIGMNTAIANSRTEGGGSGQGQNAGLGFAIPVETVQSIVEQIIGSNMVIRGFLGVRIGLLTDEIRGLTKFNGRGVIIGGNTDPEPDSPAGKAGIKRGDIIVSLDGKPTSDPDVLRSMISVRRPGETVTLGVWRDGGPMEIRAKLGAAYTRVEGPGFFRPIPIPGGEDMTMDQLRDWVKGQEPPPPPPEQ